MSEWQPIETAPKDGTPIIGLLEYPNDNVYINVKWIEEDKDGEAGWWSEWNGKYDPVYWIPLPTLPKKKHFCTNNSISCESDADGKMFLSTYDKFGRKIHMYIETCPFCGEKNK